MGKAKDSRKQKKKLKIRNSINPVGVMSLEDSEKEAQIEEIDVLHSQVEGNNTASVAKIINQLNSVCSSERETACLVLASVFSNEQDGFDDSNFEKDVELLFAAGAINKLCQQLCDPEKSVRTAAAGGLRNLAVSGGEEICKKLVSCDICTTLFTSFSQTVESFDNIKEPTIESTTSSPSANSQISEQRQLIDCLTQLLYLMSSLCEQNDIATKQLSNNNNIVHLFMMILKSPRSTNDLLIDTAKCFVVISDENRAIQSQIISNSNYISELVSLMNNSKVLHLKVLISGILFNVQTHDNVLTIAEQMIPPLIASLQFDSVGSMLQIVPELGKDEISETHKNWRNEVSAQRTSLEILANLTNVLAFLGEKQQDGDDDDEMIEYDDNDDSNLTDQTQPEFESKCPEFEIFVKKSSVLSKVLDCFVRLSQPPHNIVLSSPHIHTELPLIRTTNLRCLNCLNNLILASNVNILSSFDTKLLWNILNEMCVQSAKQFQQILQNTPNDKQKSNEALSFEIEKMESLTQLIWTILKKPLPESASISMTAAQTQFYSQLSNISQSEEIRTNCIAIFGEMGKKPHTPEQNKQLATFLLKKLSTDSSLSVICETLNAIFDIYADKNYNQVMLELNMIPLLFKFSNNFQSVINRFSKGISVTLMNHAKETKFNLTRFIKYKKKEMNLKQI